MYDYTQGESFHIENVDHEIHILGITMSAIVNAIAIYTVSMPFIGPLGIGLVFLYFVASRHFFMAQQRGEPIEYGERFVLISKKFPLIAPFFGLDRIIYSEGVYRE